MLRRSMLVSIVLILSACTNNMGSYSVLSTGKDIDLNVNYEKISDSVVGVDTEYIFVVVPTGELTIVDAINDIFSKFGGDIIKNAQVKQHFIMIPPFFSKFWIDVKGELWKRVDRLVKK